MAAGLTHLDRAPVSAPPRTGSTAADHARRLDWRFLLPSPALSRVFFSGSLRSTLLRALWEHGCEVVVSPPAPLNGWYDHIVGQFDLCVLQCADDADIERAANLLAPGGWLYWEVDRVSPLSVLWRRFPNARRKGSARSAGLSGRRRVLERSGFRAIATWWHYPDFDSCRWIVPLEDRAGIRYVLRNGPALFRPIGEWLGARIIDTALFPGVGSSVSFVAQKPAPPEAGT
jgi:hypothetical protein